jgi:hypothetical protein
MGDQDQSTISTLFGRKKSRMSRWQLNLVAIFGYCYYFGCHFDILYLGLNFNHH